MTQRMHEENAAFPLSQSQQNIWDLEKAYSGTSINHITTSVRIQGQFRLDLLQKSIRLLLESDSSLRTRIEMREGKLVQYIVPMEEEAVPVFDFSLSGQDGVENWAQALAREPMPVLGGALCRFWLFKTGENDGGILMKLHHLISDGWSQVLLCNKLQKIYLDLLEGRTVRCRLRRNTGCMSARSSSICKAPPAEKMRLTGQRSSSKAASRPRSSRFTARRSARWESAKAI